MKTETRYVLGFLINLETDEVVLILKNRPDFMRGTFTGIGGHIEEGETPENCIKREFKEETGVSFIEWELFATITRELPQHSGFVYVFRGFSNRTAEIRTGTTDEIVMKIKIKDLTNYNLYGGTEALIKLALDVNLTTCILNYKEK